MVVTFGIHSGITIRGNFIGTDATGTKPLGNGYIGIVDSSELSGSNQILGNVVSSNGYDGIEERASSFGSGQVSIQGNYIGTDLTGTQPLGNVGTGLSAFSSAPIDLSGNVISANGFDGVILYNSGSTVQGNEIGTDVTGTQPLGNKSVGIDVEAGNILVGDPTGVNGNVIADNGGAGVVVGYSTGDAVLGNSIQGNAGLGIDLGGNGVTLNTPGGPHYGPNNLQNFPVLGVAVNFGASTAIQGTLNGAPTSTFTVQLFSSPAADPSGYGEGQKYLGSTTVTTDAAGNGAFNVTFPVAVPAGQVIGATATDSIGDTSEFSKDFVVVAAMPPVAAINDAYTTDVNTTLSVAAPGVIANDLSADNGAFTASLVDNAAHGSVALNPDGSFTYTPMVGFVGNDSFTYVDHEGMSTSNVATVTITVNSKTQLVTNTADSGPGSLRQALTIAAGSNSPAPDAIRFAIPGVGPFVIHPVTPLPAVTHATIIDGYSQPGASVNTLAVGDNAVILVQLEGSLVSGIGLDVSASGSKIKGLSITGFATGVEPRRRRWRLDPGRLHRARPGRAGGPQLRRRDHDRIRWRPDRGDLDGRAERGRLRVDHGANISSRATVHRDRPFRHPVGGISGGRLALTMPWTPRSAARPGVRATSSSRSTPPPYRSAPAPSGPPSRAMISASTPRARRPRTARGSRSTPRDRHRHRRDECR